MSLCVVHLLWAPLGVEPIERFAASYARHPAGRDHRLVAVFNGFTTGAQRAAAREALGGRADDELHLSGPVLDLAAYAAALRDAREERVVFLNSYAEPLVDGWLQLLVGHLDDPAVGMVGASGSWESAASVAPPHLRPVRHLRFPRFPNPHLRSNAFALPRELALDLRWPMVRGKWEAHALESGRQGLTRQVALRGRRTVVAGRDGRAYDPQDWPASATFRSGDQANLLVADNRTHQYAQAGEEGRALLARMAWGRGAA